MGFITDYCFSQTAWKDDWRTSSIAELEKHCRQGGRGGWTEEKVIEAFGKPDNKVSPEDFRMREAHMSYKLYSGLTFQVVRNQDTDTKRYGDKYFATFQVIDPEVDEGNLIRWSVNVSRPLTDAEKKEFRDMIERSRAVPEQPSLPPTDTPPSKLDSKTSHSK